MRNLVLLCIAAFSGLFFTVNTSKVNWTFEKRTNKGAIELVLTASIEKGWHIYSQYLKGDGPIPTSFSFTMPKGLKADGTPKEPTPISHYDENFGMEVKYFNDKVVFVQSLKGKPAKGSVVKGTVTFMVCNDEMCLPPTDVKFEIKL